MLNTSIDSKLSCFCTSVSLTWTFLIVWEICQLQFKVNLRYRVKISLSFHAMHASRHVTCLVFHGEARGCDPKLSKGTLQSLGLGLPIILSYWSWQVATFTAEFDRLWQLSAEQTLIQAYLSLSLNEKIICKVHSKKVKSGKRILHWTKI